MKGLPQNVSESVRRLNPHLYAVDRLSSANPEPNSGDAAAPKVRRKKGSSDGLVRGSHKTPAIIVSIISYRKRMPDDDGLIGGSAKFLRDAIAASLRIDDGDPRIKFEYATVITQGSCGTAVKIEVYENCIR